MRRVDQPACAGPPAPPATGAGGRARGRRRRRRHHGSHACGEPTVGVRARNLAADGEPGPRRRTSSTTVEQGWLLTRSHDDVDAVRALGRRGGGLARRRPVAPPPRAHRRAARSSAAPRTSCRSTTGSARCSPAVRCSTTASALLGEPAVLYKEKINYKLPGGAGLLAPPGRARLPVRRHPRVVHGGGRRRAGRQRLPRGGVGLPPRAAPHRRHRLHPRRRRRRARLGAGGGAGRRDAVVPLAHAAPQRTEPRAHPAAGAVPHLQRPAARATCAPPTTSRRRPSWRAAPRCRSIGDFQGRTV